MTDYHVICMKWGTAFAAEDVNVLHNACRRRTTLPFRFICLTDDAEGLAPGVETMPIPDMGLPKDQWLRPGVWPKIALYHPDLHGLRGRALFIDLDMMILDSLDDFLTFPASFVTTDMGRSWRPGGGSSPPEPGTCIFAFSLGNESQLFEQFGSAPEAAIRTYRNDQNFAAAYASSMAFWPDGWVISFKRWLRRPIGLDLFLEPRRPPPSAKVLAFHGTPRPTALLRPGGGLWDRFPHMGRGQVSWVVEYWREMGGTIPE
ncbi:hypothetical protein [Alkalilacustris brevis]|uniref:hypothetical protein n=1 Tax=Alkalilacustris brevis TaxID=2026338 RepID=UPI0012D30683|nr:hypothetical protein [Alkalilacustris brevis]